MRDLTATLNYLQEKHRDALIVYRDTPTGHIKSSAFERSTPLSIEAFQRLTRECSNDSLYRQYHYGSLDGQNGLVRRLVEKRFPEILFMSVANSTNLRWDSHADPLHYCIPGPIDHWAQKLIDVLLVADAFPELLPATMRVGKGA
jgi:hypothetical protein